MYVDASLPAATRGRGIPRFTSDRGIGKRKQPPLLPSLSLPLLLGSPLPPPALPSRPPAPPLIPLLFLPATPLQETALTPPLRQLLPLCTPPPPQCPSIPKWPQASPLRPHRYTPPHHVTFTLLPPPTYTPLLWVLLRLTSNQACLPRTLTFAETCFKRVRGNQKLLFLQQYLNALLCVELWWNEKQRMGVKLKAQCDNRSRQRNNVKLQLDSLYPYLTFILPLSFFVQCLFRRPLLQVVF